MKRNWNTPIHTNAIGNQYVVETCAREIIDNHKDYFQTDISGNHFVQIGEAMLAPGMEEEIAEFLEGIKKSLPKTVKGRIGAVVVNCNPMTNGHLYLYFPAEDL